MNLRRLIVCAMTVCAAVLAQGADTAWTGREHIAARFERLGEDELKGVFLRSRS